MSNRPRPTALRELEGNPGHRPLNKNEPKPGGVPICPSELSDGAKTEWRRISKELLSLGLLTKVDRAALSAYCELWARWRDAEAKIKEFGTVIKTKNGNLIQSPYVGIANRALALMKGYLIEFGFTPASRANLVSDTPLDAEGKLASLLIRRNENNSRCPQPPSNT